MTAPRRERMHHVPSLVVGERRVAFNQCRGDRRVIVGSRRADRLTPHGTIVEQTHEPVPKRDRLFRGECRDRLAAAGGAGRRIVDHVLKCREGFRIAELL